MPETKLTTEQFGELLANAVGKAMEKAGMNRADARAGMFPRGLNANNEVDPKIKEMKAPDRIKAFFRALINPDLEQYSVRALSEGTDSLGGFLVPDDFRTQVIIALEKLNAVRTLCSVFGMTRDTMTVPTVTSKVTATWTGEAVAHTETTPALGNILLVAHKLSLFSKMSEELLEDAAIAVQELLVRLFAEAVRNEENAVFTIGSGINRPVGIITHLNGTAYEIAPTGGAGTTTVEDVIQTFYSLPSQYRSEAVWMAHNLLIAKIRKLRDASGGAGTGSFMWTDGFGSTPPMLMGRPVVENNDIPTTRGAANRSVLLFGDWKRGYYIGDRRQLGVKVSTEASDAAGNNAFLQDQVWVKATERVDGQVALEESMVMMDEMTIV